MQTLKTLTISLPDYKPELFGTRLRRCREAIGLTRRTFAERATIGEAELKAIECNKRLPTAGQRRCLVAAIAAFNPEYAASLEKEAVRIAKANPNAALRIVVR